MENAFSQRGIMVRREKLASGPAFKVKSGNCMFSGDNLLFLDRRLPPDQQLGLLVDYLTESSFTLSSDELKLLPAQLRTMLEQRGVAAQV